LAPDAPADEEEGRSSEWPRRAMSSAEVVVVVVGVVSVLVDRDVVVALAKMDAGSGMTLWALW